MAGSIHKRFWQVNPNKGYLEKSLDFYMRGYLEGPENDFGYTGINAAFVQDLLAHIEEQAATTSKTAFSSAEFRRKNAQDIRKDLIAKLLPLLEKPENSWLIPV